MVIGHVSILQFTQWGLAFQLPLFAILSGFLFKDNQSLSEFIVKKSKMYIYPYILAFFIALAIWILVTNNRTFYSSINFTLGDVLRGFFLGYNTKLNAPLWFLPAYFLANILWLGMVTKLKLANRPKWLFLSLFFLLLLTGYFIYIPLHFFSNPQPIPFAIDLSFTFAAYISLGMFLKRVKLPSLSNLFSILVLAILFFIGGKVNFGKINFYGRYYNNFSIYILNTITGSLLVISITQWLEKQNNRIASIFNSTLNSLGKSSMTILIFHWPSLILLNSIFDLLGVYKKLQIIPTLVTVTFPVSDNHGDLLLKFGFLTLFTIWGVGLPLSVKELFNLVQGRRIRNTSYNSV